MKLRSESRTAAPPIPFLLPDTQAITVSNASSPLLRLPQELKDRIYQLVYGGFFTVIRSKRNNDLYVYTYVKSGMACSEACKFRLRKSAKRGLPVASLGICRQIYHEAKDVLFSANEFTFKDPRTINTFIRRLDNLNHRSLAVRTLYVYVDVYYAKDEREWNNTFHVLAESLKNLRHIRIFINDHMWNGYCYAPPRRQSPAEGKKPFLQGLLELKKLPLKTFELVVTENVQHRDLRGDAYSWTNDQQREWTRKMEHAILSSEGM